MEMCGVLLVFKNLWHISCRPGTKHFWFLLNVSILFSNHTLPDSIFMHAPLKYSLLPFASDSYRKLCWMQPIKPMLLSEYCVSWNDLFQLYCFYHICVIHNTSQLFPRLLKEIFSLIPPWPITYFSMWNLMNIICSVPISITVIMIIYALNRATQESTLKTL